MRELKEGVYFPRGLPLAGSVHNTFGGIRDLAIFLWRYSGCELQKQTRSGNFDNEQERDFPFFIGVGCGNRKGRVAGYRN